MTRNDILMFVRDMRPDMAEDDIDDLSYPLLYHLEKKIREEVLHLEQKFDQLNLALRAPHDDVYWTYILLHLDLIHGNFELYREDCKLFEQAWKNLCRQVFLQKENFKLAPLPSYEEEL